MGVRVRPDRGTSRLKPAIIGNLGHQLGSWETWGQTWGLVSEVPRRCPHLWHPGSALPAYGRGRARPASAEAGQESVAALKAPVMLTLDPVLVGGGGWRVEMESVKGMT
jgi:hypothetical protein